MMQYFAYEKLIADQPRIEKKLFECFFGCCFFSKEKEPQTEEDRLMEDKKYGDMKTFPPYEQYNKR